MKLYLLCIKKKKIQDFPGGPLDKASVPNAGGLGSIPGQGTRFYIPRLKTWFTALKPSAAK